MAERKVSDMVNDIYSGISFQAFLQKYEFPESKITSVLTYLVKKGGLTEREAKIWFNTARKNQPQSPIERTQEPIEKSSKITLNESTIPCPFCGEDIKKIAKKCKHCGEFLDKAPTPLVQSYEKVSVVQEEIIWEGHPSHLNYIAHYILGVMLLPVWLLGSLFIIYAVIDQKTKVFTITNKKIHSKMGIIARNAAEISIKDIRSINFKQNFSDRLIGVGSVEIASAATGSIEVTFKGISQPEQIKKVISELKNSNL